MRHQIKKHEVNVDSKNPAFFYSRDLQAYATCKEFLQALRTQQLGKAGAIKRANEDLSAYFTYIEGAFQKNPYYEV